MKTAKKVITISFLTIAIILLIAFGIKTNKFSTNKTTTPVAQHRSSIRVDAENLEYVSKKWLLNKNMESVNTGTNAPSSFTDTTQEFTAYYTDGTKKTYTGFRYDSWYNYVPSTYYSEYGKQLSFPYSGSSWGITAYQWYTGTNSSANLSHLFGRNEMRIVEFTNTPTGNIYTLLNAYGKQAYNSDILIFASGQPTYETNAWNNNFKNTGINEIRKDNLTISKEDVATGKFINESGIIQLYLDAGITSLKINGTEYYNSQITAINITNTDIVIDTTGTNSGNTSSVFTINYFNTRPTITPQPYPDPGSQVVEVLDITGLMFEILTMPFSFITQAFNVTLWEGTPYQFNFSNFILSLIAIATLIFIIKLFTSGFSVISNYTASRDDREFKRSQIRLNNSKTALNNRTDPNHKTRDSRSVSVNVNHNYKHKE